MRLESIQLTKLDMEKCMQFANESVDSSLSHYKKRNNTSRSRIIQDIYTGKCGELGVWKMLKRKGFNATKPDFEIYHGRKKSFDADITCGKYQIHCKAQTEESMLKYGSSWILQYGGKGYGHTDKLFKHQESYDMLAPTMVTNGLVTIFGIIPLVKIFEENMVRMPKCDWFANSKRAIYWDDLKELNWYNRWGFLAS